MRKDRAQTPAQKREAEVRQRRARIERRAPASVSPETALFARCVAIAQPFMMSYVAYGHTAREVVELAAAEYGGKEWLSEGLRVSSAMDGYDGGVAQRFYTYAYKRCYEWKRTDKRKDGKVCATFQLYKNDIRRRNEELGLWLGDPEARLVELQRVIRRQRGRDDKTVVLAIRAAQDELATTEAGDRVDEAERLIKDAPPEAQRFIIHGKKK